MTKRRENNNPKAGDSLRDLTADLLSQIWGKPEIEKRIGSIKVDVWFRRRNMGADEELFVECKDYEEHLTKSQVTQIWAAYTGALQESASDAKLLLVTRRGITTDAELFVHEHRREMRHQTIFEIENSVMDFEAYWRDLAGLFSEDKLDQYYIEQRATGASTDTDPILIHDHISDWLNNENNAPLAILGGYGAGKSSLAKRVASEQASKVLKDPSARGPILIKLGDLAKRTDLKGLLGGQFTADYPTSGFGFNPFMKMNAKGRFVVLLDGFDEMKHAMHWIDFRNQIRDLLPLTEGNSKVVLLGRPSAFLSEDEERHILRGEVRDGQLFHKLPDWPAFLEFHLSPFSEAERAEFVQRYIQAFNSNSSSEWRENRALQLNEIAALNPEVFEKPVHAKLLTEIASAPDFDLSGLSENVSKWSLYSAFFTQLFYRESGKAARADVSMEHRVAFLQRIALWLWEFKDGVTHFRLEEIPSVIVEEFCPEDHDGTESKLRELLVGPCLERKGESMFYFSHRSFAEFLVARAVHQLAPITKDLGRLSKLSKDGVFAFLAGVPLDKSDTESIAKNFRDAKGDLSLNFLFYLSQRLGDLNSLKNKKRQSPPAWACFEFLESNNSNLVIDLERLSERLPRVKSERHFLHLCYLYISATTKSVGRGQNNALGAHFARVAAAILERFWTAGQTTGSSDLRGARLTTLKRYLSPLHGRRMEFDFARLLEDLSSDKYRVIASDFDWHAEIQVGALSVSIEWEDILELIPEKKRELIVAHYEKNGYHPVLVLSR